MGRRGPEPAIVKLERPLLAVGAGIDTSDRTIGRDAAALGARLAGLRSRLGLAAAEPRLFVAVTADYDPAAGTYRYAMGDLVEGPGGSPPELERIEIPAGRYAAFAVRPLLGFLWGPAIGRAYARIYGSWLPASAWRHDPRSSPEGRRVEHFEYHDERAARKRGAEIEIRVPVAPKEQPRGL